jgi:hypothetical protein
MAAALKDLDKRLGCTFTTKSKFSVASIHNLLYTKTLSLFLNLSFATLPNNH